MAHRRLGRIHLTLWERVKLRFTPILVKQPKPKRGKLCMIYWDFAGDGQLLIRKVK
jgi:hypothetical protein